MKTLLELEHVSYAYHTKNGETPALSDISFQIREGEFIAITGPSGCGKSTLLSLICGLAQPEKGTIRLYSQTPDSPHTEKKEPPEESTKTVSDKKLRSRLRDANIGYMLQRDHLFEWRTIYRNVILGLEIQNRLNPATLTRVDQLLKDYGLWEFREARPSQLSGGMRQRAALIRTLALDPDLLLLDEPFSALDFQTRLNVCDDVVSILKREGKTAILVTHDLSEAISTANRIFVLTNRPAHISRILDISFEDPDLTPLRKRSAPEFQQYFNILWKEMHGHG